MENNPTWIAVVALALIDDAGRILLQQRPHGRHHGGLWEFPGGKVETGESPRDALVREIEEELALKIDPAQLQPSGFADETSISPDKGGKRQVVLFLYTARHACGEPQARDGQDWGWFSAAEASQLELAPMDRQLLAQIALQSS